MLSWTLEFRIIENKLFDAGGTQDPVLGDANGAQQGVLPAREQNWGVTSDSPEAIKKRERPPQDGLENFKNKGKKKPRGGKTGRQL